jgi:hypothetical protein
MRAQGNPLREQPWAPITTPFGGREIGAAVTADGAGDGVDEVGAGGGFIGGEQAVVEVVEQAGDGDEAGAVEGGAGVAGEWREPEPLAGVGMLRQWLVDSG